MEGKNDSNNSDNNLDNDNSITANSDSSTIRHGEDNERTDNPTGRISEEQCNRISFLFIEKEFSEDRIKKALDYYKMDSIEEFSFIEAAAFISQLEKA